MIHLGLSLAALIAGGIMIGWNARSWREYRRLIRSGFRHGRRSGF